MNTKLDELEKLNKLIDEVEKTPNIMAPMSPKIAARIVAAQIPLLPCPFCGLKAKVKCDSEQDMQARIPYDFVECENCRARGPSFSAYGRGNEDEAVRVMNAKSAWNVRMG